MLQELDGVELKTEYSNKRENTISFWSGVLLTFVLGALSYTLYLQVRLSNLLSPLSIDYSDYTKFGVISDIHLDVRQNETYCQLWDGFFSHYKSAYGTSGCDTHYKFAEETMKSFSNHLDIAGNIDFVLSLGDFVNHYTSNFLENEKVIANVTHLLKSTISVPIYPTLGNDDMPEDYLLPSNSTQFFESIWDVISPTMNVSLDTYLSKARNSFLKGGYYTIQHSNYLQIISINSVMFSVNSNVNASACLEQLQWLSDTLSTANASKRAVIVIGHIAPSFSFFQISHHKKTMLWKEDYISRYNNIVSMYERIIKFSLFAHHHSSSWFAKKMPPNKNGPAKFVGYHIIPSVSPIYNNQPSYSIGVVDSEWNLLDIWNYFSPLSFYTRQGLLPKFIFLSSFKEDFFDVEGNNDDKIKDSLIDNMLLYNLTTRLLNIDDMQNIYKKIMYKSYQLLFSFASISPYEVFCMMTENTADGITGCFDSFHFFI